jgi:hypothetical protein
MQGALPLLSNVAIPFNVGLTRERVTGNWNETYRSVLTLVNRQKEDNLGMPFELYFFCCNCLIILAEIVLISDVLAFSPFLFFYYNYFFFFAASSWIIEITFSHASYYENHLRISNDWHARMEASGWLRH